MVPNNWARKLLITLIVPMMVIADGIGEKNRCFVNRTRLARRNLTDDKGNVIPIKFELTTSLTQRILSEAFRIFLDEIHGYANIEFGEIQWQFDVDGASNRIKTRKTINMEVWAPEKFQEDSEYVWTHAPAPKFDGHIGWFVLSPFSMFDHWDIFKYARFATIFPQDPDTMSIITNYTINTELTPHGIYNPQRCKEERTLCTIMLSDDIGITDAIEQINEMELYIKLYCVGRSLQQVMSLLDQSNSSMFFIFRHWIPNELGFRIKGGYSEIILPDHAVEDKKCYHFDLHPVWPDESVSLTRLISEFFENINPGNLYDPESYLWEDPSISEYDVACMWLLKKIKPEVPKMATVVIMSEYTLREHFEKLATQGKSFTFLFSPSIGKFSHLTKGFGLIGIVGRDWRERYQRILKQMNWTEAIAIPYIPNGKPSDDRNGFVYSFQMFGSNNLSHYIYSAFMDHFDWRRVAILLKDDLSETLLYMKGALHLHNINVIIISLIPKSGGITTMKKVLSELMKQKVRIIVADVSLDSTYHLICAAFHLNMTAKQGYVWFMAESLPVDLWRANNNTNSGCTSHNLLSVIDGHFRLQRTYYGPDDQIMQENITIGQWRERHQPLPSYMGFLYDACWTYVLAFQRFMNGSPNALDTIHTTSGPKFREIIAQTDFYGLSGRVRFNGGYTRIMNYKVEQFLNNTYRTVANFYSNELGLGDSFEGGKFTVNDSAIEWLSGSIPSDGRDPPSHCMFENLAKALHVSCEIAIVIVFLVILVALAILCIIGYVILRRRFNQKTRLQEELIRLQGELLPVGPGNLDEWEIPRDEIVLNRKLGEGAFGLVYGGEALLSGQDWCPVAVKTLKIGSSTEDKCDFLSEVEMMKRFDHPNIIKLLGVCLQSEPVLTVMEFMLYGDLRSYLLARKHLVKDQGYETSDEVGYKRLTGMALDVARALSYLEQLKYIHRDVASRNCLVNTSRTIKLGDFGMTRSMYDNDYYRICRKGKFPVRWMAPESLSSGLYSPSTDVWSYGVLIHEIITFGNTPYGKMTNEQVLEYVTSGKTLSIPKTVKSTLTNLMKSCWSMDATERPTPSDITTVLVKNPSLLEPCLDVPFEPSQNDWDSTKGIC